MEEIAADKSLGFYLDTLGYLDEKHISASDEDLEYYILEELDADAHTFLHKHTVFLLIDSGYIPGSVADDSEKLRALVKELIEKKSSLAAIRFDNDWMAARQLAKKILGQIKLFQDSRKA